MDTDYFNTVLAAEFANPDAARAAYMALLNVAIAYSGLRPGEKLTEQYLADTEPTEPGPHPQILVARPRIPEGFDPESVVRELAELARGADRPMLRRRMLELAHDPSLDEEESQDGA